MPIYTVEAGAGWAPCGTVSPVCDPKICLNKKWKNAQKIKKSNGWSAIDYKTLELNKKWMV